MEVVDYDCDYGFVWIILSELDGGHTVQACLDESGKLIPHDCGHNWGVCGEVNQPAFDEFGENRCMTMLFRYAKELIPVEYRV